VNAVSHQTSLYRHFAADGSLLYVGISLSWPARTKTHARGSTWFEQVAKVEIEHFPTRADALNAEREAIKRERPKFNVVHNRPARNHVQKKRKLVEPHLDPLLRQIKGPHAIVGPALVYQGETISVLVAHGTFGTAGELTEIQLGKLFPDVSDAWTEVCAGVLTIRNQDDITIEEARRMRRDIVRRLGLHLETVQAFDTDLSLATAYATQFPSEKSRQILDKVAVESGSRG
jgi:predicted GIY-YIG superfamily endonuclease